MAARYNAYDSLSSTASSFYSDPSSSTELKRPSLKNKPQSWSRAIVKTKPSDLSRTKTHNIENPGNLTTMVKKFMEMKKTNSSSTKSKRLELLIPSDMMAEEIKKTARGKGGNGFGALQRKLFGKTEKEKKEVKALAEVKGNTRTLAMVLRSERELLSMNKDQEIEIAELKLQLEQKNREVEKLKDLCLKQREEIKSLKSAILFPDVMSNQLQELVEKQGLELTQARQVIPALQNQVTSLTGQLQCLAEDLAEVKKADKYSPRTYFERPGSSQERTSLYHHEESSDSLDFSSGDPATPGGSTDDLFLEDLNPCLTPYSKTSKVCAQASSQRFAACAVLRDENKCKKKILSLQEFEALGYKSRDESCSENSTVTADEVGLNFSNKKLFKSSDCRKGSKTSKTLARVACRSAESKGSCKKQMNHQPF